MVNFVARLFGAPHPCDDSVYNAFVDWLCTNGWRILCQLILCTNFCTGSTEAEGKDGLSLEFGSILFNSRYWFFCSFDRFHFSGQSTVIHFPSWSFFFSFCIVFLFNFSIERCHFRWNNRNDARIKWTRRGGKNHVFLYYPVQSLLCTDHVFSTYNRQIYVIV